MAENREKLSKFTTVIITWIDELEKEESLNNFLKEFKLSQVIEIGKTKIEAKCISEVLNCPTYSKKITDKLFNVLILRNWNKSVSLSWDLLHQFLLFENEETAFVYFTDIFSSERRTNVRNSQFELLAAETLKYFLENNRLVNLLWKQCLIKPVQTIRQKYVYEPSTQQQWGVLIKKIISLPDNVANKLTFGTSSTFLPINYVAILAQSILDVLQKIHDSLQNSRDCSLHFLTQLFGKLCIRGYADLAYDVLLPEFTILIRESPLWCRICSKLLVSVSDNHLESVLEPLLKRYESLDIFNHLLCSIDMKSHAKLKFLITNKLLFLKTFSNELSPYLVLNYLKSSEENFKEVLFKLLKVWGDQGSMQTTSIEQHQYLTKCILISLALMTSKQRADWKEGLVMSLLQSVQSHMECPNEKIRELGMVVAEMLTKAVDIDGKQLDFELEQTDEIETLYELAKDPLNVIRRRQKEEENNSPKKPTTSATTSAGRNQEESSYSKVENDELDSDDELEPINVRNGKEDDEKSGSVNGVQPPLYLRDCISGLLSSKDPDRLEACLNGLEKLVKRQPGDLKDLTIELLRILIHLEDEYNINNFYTTRLQATLAIVCKCPAMASEYLCGQFFEENFTINQRLDILEIISSSATHLSQPESDDPEAYRKQLPRPKLVSHHDDGVTDEKPPEWRAIVDERVQQKTRRFNSGKRKGIEAKENRLSTVIGSFFFPLLKKFGVDSQASQLLSSEPMLLGKYIYTLAVVLQAAQDLPAITPMSKALLDLVWALRFHKEAFVRQALIFSTGKIILNVPVFVLMSDMQMEILEAKDWLEGVVENDTDQECRKMAASSVILLQKTFQKELVGTS